MFAMSSFRANVDDSVNNDSRPYVLLKDKFRIGWDLYVHHGIKIEGFCKFVSMTLIMRSLTDFFILVEVNIGI